jgi:hypothetical protein
VTSSKVTHLAAVRQRRRVEAIRRESGNADLPGRGDAVEQWLLHHRDAFPAGSGEWVLLETVREDYVTHADLGLPLPGAPDGTGDGR